MIRKFNEYNNYQKLKDKRFNDEDALNLKSQIEETLIEMVDSGFEIRVFVPFTAARDRITILIKSQMPFEYPFNSDIQEQHFIEFMNWLNENYNITDIRFQNRNCRLVDIEISDILNGDIPPEFKYYPDNGIEMNYNFIYISIKKKLY